MAVAIAANLLLSNAGQVGSGYVSGSCASVLSDGNGDALT